MWQHTRKKALGPQRRWIFRVWVGLTVALSAYLLVAIPLADLFTDRFHFIVAAVPPVMALLVLIGIGWLVWLVTARRARPPSEEEPGTGTPEALDPDARPPGNPRRRDR